MTQVGIADPARCANAWPHELSGGMRQRVMIAMAIATSPSLLIADEPTTALDATIQAQILDLLDELKQQTGMGIVIITHDLSVVARLCQRVVVLYAGQVVEETDVHTLFAQPRHPYTRALLAARPSADHPPKTPLAEISGQVPSLHAFPSGCTYADRCPLAQPRCRAQAPSCRRWDTRHSRFAAGGPRRQERLDDDTTIKREQFVENIPSPRATGACGG